VAFYLRNASATARPPAGDADLARRLRAGDELAFEAFFAEYFARLYRFARLRVGGDDDAAEEIAQATLIKALAKLSTYRGEAALFTWLCSFCRHEISRWVERTGRRVDLSVADETPLGRAILDSLAALTRDDPENEYQRQELGKLVHHVLVHLPGSYGDALAWKYLDGASVEEIGRRLGVGYKAAESLLTRAREAFREEFAVVADRKLERPRMGGTSEGP
jgi:RNA polymerase sigma-70 factor (ECF subfamily)